MATFAPDFSTAMGACTAQLRGLEHTTRLAERFARVLAQFADGTEAVCRRTGNAPVECSNELACFLHSENEAIRGRARTLQDFAETCRKALRHQQRYLDYLQKRARNVPPEAAAEFSAASSAELEKLRGEQAWMEKQFRALVCGREPHGASTLPPLSEAPVL